MCRHGPTGARVADDEGTKPPERRKARRRATPGGVESTGGRRVRGDRRKAPTVDPGTAALAGSTEAESLDTTPTDQPTEGRAAAGALLVGAEIDDATADEGMDASESMAEADVAAVTDEVAPAIDGPADP